MKYIEREDEIDGIVTEEGFYKYTEKKNSKYQCAHYVINESGDKCYCEYNKRTTYHQQNKGRHKHGNWSNITPDRKIDSYVASTISTVLSQRQACKQIYKKICRFSGKHGVSLSTAASVDMFGIIYETAHFTLMNRDLFKKQAVEKVIPKISRYYLKNLMIEDSKEIFDNTIEQIKSFYLTITLDAGTPGNSKILNFMIACPQKKTTLAITCIDLKDNTTLNYVNKVIEFLNRDDMKNLKFSAIVADGLPAQESALNHQKKTCFQQINSSYPLQLYNKDHKQILFSPCLCHRTQLVFKHMTNKNKLLKIWCTELHDISIKLRKTPARTFINAACPEPSPTRWLYVYNILQLLYKYKKIIMEYISSTNELVIDWDKIDIYFRIISPLAALILHFEADRSQLFMAYGLITQAIERLQEIQLENTEIMESIRFSIQELNNMTIHSKNGYLLSLEYLLSVHGRNKYRSSRNLSTTKISKENEIILYNLEKKKDISSSDMNEISVSPDRDEEVFGQIDGDDEENENNDIINSEEEPVVEPIMDKGSLYLNATEGLNQVMSSLKYNIIDFNTIQREFLYWLKCDDSELPCPALMELNGGLDFWTEVFNFEVIDPITKEKKFHRLHHVAEISLRFLGITCSEACVERLISSQNHIVATTGYSNSKELMMARLIQSTTK